MRSIGSSVPGGVFSAMVVMAATCGMAAAAETAATRAAIDKASSDYVEAYNTRDFQALADQWTVGATLVEGGSRVTGREAIVASIRGWLEKHPQAKVQIKVSDVELVAASLARVRGVITFVREAGARPVDSRFDSLRVLEDGAWRLAESFVAPSHAAALDDLGWLVGAWRATDAKTGVTVDAVFEKAAGGFALVGRMTTTPKTGAPIEAIEIVHADRGDRTIRTAIIDSTGAHAEGVIESDGMTLNRLLVGEPSDAVAARRAQWVQTIVPGGDGQFTMQAIERSLDGRPIPDSQPLHFRRK